MSKAPQEKPNAWDDFQRRLTPFATEEVHALQNPAKVFVVKGYDESAVEYDSWLKTLSPATQAEVDQLHEEDLGPDQELFRYSLVEAPDGEWPPTRVFKSAEAMATYIGTLDGQDTVVIPFFGAHVPVTEGPVRYLLLHDSDTAIRIPKNGELPTRHKISELELTVQADGYLGPDELINARKTVPPPPPRKKPKPAEPTDDEDDEETNDFGP